MAIDLLINTLKSQLFHVILTPQFFFVFFFCSFRFLNISVIDQSVGIPDDFCYYYGLLGGASFNTTRSHCYGFAVVMFGEINISP